MDASNLKYNKNFFDAVTCISALEHMPDYNKAVEEMVSVVKKTGFLF